MSFSRFINPNLSKFLSNMKPSKNNALHRGLIIGSRIASIFLVTVAVVFLILWFATLKPKDPEITIHPYGLQSVDPFSMLVTANITLNVSITINNHQNVGSLKFRNATAYLNYHDDVIAEIPIGQNVVPAHGKLDVNTSAKLMVNKMIANGAFFDDVGKGSFNLTAKATLHGKVNLSNFLKMHATAFTTCDITFVIASRHVESLCKSKIKL